MPTFDRGCFLRAAGAALSWTACGGLAAAAAPAPLRVVYFPGANVLPTWVAIRRGFFARHGLDVSMTPTPGSVYQFQHLAAGDFDVALTAIDNAVAYDNGQGAAPIAAGIDFVALMGGDSGFLRLLAQPEIRGYADLRGKVLAVDALTTGFAFVLRRMLEANGLGADDYRLEAAGGTLQRFDKMRADTRYAATLLFPPFDIQARAAGFADLGSALDVLKRYEGTVPVTTTRWLAANGRAAESFVRAHVQALRWLRDPANRSEATRILADTSQLSAPLAAATLDALLVPGGFDPDGRIDPAGIETVLDVRARYASPRRDLGHAARYFVPRFDERAKR